MGQKAIVTSVDAIDEFRSALATYLSKARPALEEASAEITRTRTWLENDQRAYWENQVRRRTRDLEEAQQALFGARISFLQREGSAEVLAAQKAKRSVEEAQQKLRIVKHWIRDFESRVQPLAKQMEKLQTVLSNDMVVALAYLNETIKTLDEYVRLPAPGAAAPGPAGEPPGTQPGSSGTQVNP